MCRTVPRAARQKSTGTMVVGGRAREQLKPHAGRAVGAWKTWVPRLYTRRMVRPTPPEIVLRRTTAADVPLLHAFELDESSNALAGTKPRDWPTFRARWAEILADPDGTVTRVTPRVIIVAGGGVVGAVNISPHDGSDSIGYWIAREHWGRGIATRAVALMLGEFARRPLYATAAGHNHPSIRVLQKNGFEVVSRRMTPETSRTVQRESVLLVLR